VPLNIDDVLTERTPRNGEFRDNARYAQALKKTAMLSPNWERMTDLQRESCERIFGKLGRILAGDPDYADHWDDIAGYARLVSKDLERGAQC